MCNAFRCALAAGVLFLGLGGGVASAAPCVSSTPSSGAFTDPFGDSGVSADLVSVALSVDAGCRFTLSYGIGNQSQMYSGDFVSWFLDTDNSLATGSASGFKGADYAVGRLAGGYAALSKWDPGSGSFTTVKAVQATGEFGTQLNLTDLDPANAATFAVSGGSSYTDPDGYVDYDFAPDAGLAAVPFGVQFISTAPAPAPVGPPAPAPVPAAVAPPQPAPVSAPMMPSVVAQSAPAARCKVPVMKGLAPAVATRRLKAAHCRAGKRSYVTSKALAGRIVRSTPRAGSTLAAGASVRLVVGRAPRKHRAHGKKARASAARSSASATVNRLLNQEVGVGR